MSQYIYKYFKTGRAQYKNFDDDDDDSVVVIFSVLLQLKGA